MNDEQRDMFFRDKDGIYRKPKKVEGSAVGTSNANRKNRRLSYMSTDYYYDQDVRTGICFFCKRHGDAQKSVRTGDFSLDKSASDVYYLQNGFYRFNGVWKLRGLGKLGRKEVEHVDTIERNGRLYYQYFVNRTKQLRSSIIQGQISEIGKIKPHERQVDLNADNKRFWLGELSAINHETNDSVPISLNHFEI